MKLVLARQDYVRLQILSRKISNRAISADGLETQSVTYFTYMAKYYIHEKMIIDVAKSYQKILATLEKVPEGQMKQEDEIQKAFCNYILYLLIAPQSEEKETLLAEIETKYARNLDQEELLAKYIKKFLTFELFPLKEEEVR